MKKAFWSRPWWFNEILGDDRTQEFKVGDCHGLWTYTDTSYQIVAIINEKPGNGDFEIVLDWFEQSCRRDNKYLEFMELWNKKLRRHLIKKRGFVPIKGTENLRKIFK